MMGRRDMRETMQLALLTLFEIVTFTPAARTVTQTNIPAAQTATGRLSATQKPSTMN